MDIDINKQRIRYLVICIVLFFVEVLIALFVHDDFVRPYIGDVLVVFVVYSAVRVLFPKRIKYLSIYTFIFAVSVELLQLINIVEILGFGDNRFISVLVGSVFDIKDIICYGVGCLVLFVFELKIKDKWDR